MNNELGTYLYDGNIQELFAHASLQLYNAVAHTIGPNGTNTAIPTGNDFLAIINDGKTIIDTISSKDPAEKLAINTLKESAYATNKESGDGTSSTIILQHQLLLNILEHNENCWKEDPTGIPITSVDVLKARDILLEDLPKYKKDIETPEDLKKVITVALGSDKFTDIVYSAFEGLDKTQKPALVKVNTQRDTDFVKVDGISLAPVEVNPVVLRSMSASNDEPLDIIILNQEVSRIDNAFAALLKQISSSSKKTILLYTDIKPSVMDQLLFNIDEGALNLIPIRIAMNMQNIDAIVNDLEEYFGCKAFSDLNPYQTNYKYADEYRGKGIGYILNKDSVIIKNDNDDYGKKEHMLPASSSAIQVGFITYSQQAEDYRRLEDAVQSAYNAINYGYVLGAGFTYFSMCNVLPDEMAVIRQAMCGIFNSLCTANVSSQFEFINTIEDSVYDSYKVAEQVILNSFTVVAQILSTRCLLVPYQRNRMTGELN